MTDLTPIPNAAFPLELPRGGEGSLWGAWYMTAPADATPEMILQPLWWQHIAARFTPGDTVEVQSQSKTFHLKLLVRAVRPTSVDCTVLSEWREPLPAAMSSAGMQVRWGSGSWRIEMVASSEVVRSGFQSRTEAAAVMVAMTETRPPKGTKAAA